MTPDESLFQFGKNGNNGQNARRSVAVVFEEGPEFVGTTPDLANAKARNENPKPATSRFVVRPSITHQYEIENLDLNTQRWASKYYVTFGAVQYWTTRL